MKQKIKCECDKEGILKQEIKDLYDKKSELPFVKHKPNECKCTNDLKKYLRIGKEIYLCSCCTLSSDELVQLK